MNQRDLDLLSSYLDGQLRPSDSARLEKRLSSDPNLRSVLDDLRSARGLLRRLPMRKAPRNFTLTPQMVRRKPPLPRAYPAFRFVTALASLLFFFTLGLNFMVPQLARTQAFGMGGGGAPEILQAPAATQLPAATQAPAMQAPAATAAPATLAPTQAPANGLAAVTTPTPAVEAPPGAPQATAVAPSMQDTARAAETPSEKTAPQQETGPQQPQGPGILQTRAVRPPVPPIWVILLAGIALLGILAMLWMRRLAAERWRQK